MMRLISILLLIAGLLAAGLGGAALMDQHFPKAETPAMASVPDYADAAASPQEAPAEMAAAEPAPSEPPAPSAIVEADEPMPAPAPEATGETDMQPGSASPSEDAFSFQPMMEEAPPEAAPMMRSARPEPSESEDLAAADASPEAVDIDDPNVTAAVSESFIDKLKTVPVAHETPPSAEYKRAFDVTFAIDATGDTTAADALPGRGVIQEGEARVSDRVEVRLSGAAFTINPTSPPVQSLSPLTENTWRWSVTALSAGDPKYPWARQSPPSSSSPVCTSAWNWPCSSRSASRTCGNGRPMGAIVGHSDTSAGSTCARTTCDSVGP